MDKIRVQNLAGVLAHLNAGIGSIIITIEFVNFRKETENLEQ